MQELDNTFKKDLKKEEDIFQKVRYAKIKHYYKNNQYYLYSSMMS